MFAACYIVGSMVTVGNCMYTLAKITYIAENGRIIHIDASIDKNTPCKN